MKKIYDESINCRASKHPSHTFLVCVRLAFMLEQNKRYSRSVQAPFSRSCRCSGAAYPM